MKCSRCGRQTFMEKSVRVTLSRLHETHDFCNETCFVLWTRSRFIDNQPNVNL